MNNKNFEVLSNDIIYQTINRSNCCKIAICSDNQPYIYTMYYNLELKDDKFIFKLVSKNYDEKMKYLEKNQKVSLEIEVFNQNSIDIIKVIGLAKMKPNENNPNYFNECNIKIIPNCITGKRFYF